MFLLEKLGLKYHFYDVSYMFMFPMCSTIHRIIGFTNISAYHHYRCEFESCSDEVYSIQHYVDICVSHLHQWVVISRYFGFLNQ